MKEKEEEKRKRKTRVSVHVKCYDDDNDDVRKLVPRAEFRFHLDLLLLYEIMVKTDLQRRFHMASTYSFFLASKFLILPRSLSRSALESASLDSNACTDTSICANLASLLSISLSFNRSDSCNFYRAHGKYQM